MTNLIAQTQQNIGAPIRGIGPYGLEGSPNANVAGSRFSTFLTATVGILTLVAGIWFIFLLISGAIAWMGSGGDKGKIEDAQKRITSGIIGLAVIVAALFIVEIIGNILGFNDILNPSYYIDSVLAP